MSDKKLDITSTAIEKGIEVVKDFLEKLIGPTIEEVGLLISDNIKLWRFKNQIRILNKAKKYVEEKNITTKELSLKILVPLLESASLEEEESLQDKWAALIANMANTENHYETSIFPYMLSQLSSEEAKGLDFIAEYWSATDKELVDNFGLYDSNTSNFIRLGLVRRSLPKFTPAKEGHDDRYGYYKEEAKLEESNTLELTELGYNFTQACK